MGFDQSTENEIASETHPHPDLSTALLSSSLDYIGAKHVLRIPASIPLKGKEKNRLCYEAEVLTRTTFGNVSDSFYLSGQRTPNQNLLYIGSTFIYLANPYIAVNAFYREVADITVAAVDLYCIRTDFFCHF